jgi:hypothetical protein
VSPLFYCLVGVGQVREVTRHVGPELRLPKYIPAKTDSIGILGGIPGGGGRGVFAIAFGAVAERA